MRQSSMITSEVSEARSPILFSFLPGRNPGVPCSTTNAEIPCLPCPCRSPRRRRHVADGAVRVKVFEPLSTQSSPSSTRRRARPAGVRARGRLGQAPATEPLARGQTWNDVLLVAGLFGTRSGRCGWFTGRCVRRPRCPTEPSTRDSSSTERPATRRAPSSRHAPRARRRRARLDATLPVPL